MLYLLRLLLYYLQNIGANLPSGYSIIIILAIAIIIIIILSINKSKKYHLEIEDLKNKLVKQEREYRCILNNYRNECNNIISNCRNECNNEISNCRNECSNEINNYRNECSNKLNNYREEVKKNLIKTVVAGEWQILREFYFLFENPLFSDFTVYHQLAYKKENDSAFKRMDFFVVSPQGLFVIESKYWKGTTYIYRQGCHNFLDNPQFDSFGKGSNLKVRVFNAKKNGSKEEQIILSSYRNPIAEVREYSEDLLTLIEVPKINNIVVFHTGDDYDVIIDDKHILQSPVSANRSNAINICTLDNYTSIISDHYIGEFFTSYKNDRISAAEINERLEALLKSHMIQYNFKMDVHNYMEAPFKFLVEERE